VGETEGNRATLPFGLFDPFRPAAVRSINEHTNEGGYVQTAKKCSGNIVPLFNQEASSTEDNHRKNKTANHSPTSLGHVAANHRTFKGHPMGLLALGHAYDPLGCAWDDLVVLCEDIWTRERAGLELGSGSREAHRIARRTWRGAGR
jgi:hypothetical protein